MEAVENAGTDEIDAAAERVEDKTVLGRKEEPLSSEAG